MTYEKARMRGSLVSPAKTLWISVTKRDDLSRYEKKIIP
jgi:hypothetical protein